MYRLRTESGVDKEVNGRLVEWKEQGQALAAAYVWSAVTEQKVQIWFKGHYWSDFRHIATVQAHAITRPQPDKK